MAAPTLTCLCLLVFVIPCLLGLSWQPNEGQLQRVSLD